MSSNIQVYKKQVYTDYIQIGLQKATLQMEHTVLTKAGCEQSEI